MQNTRALLCISAIAFAAAPGLRAAERMTPGNWEFQMDTAGQDARTIKRCITAEEAAGANGDATAGRAWAEKKAAGNCAVKQFDVDGNTVSFKLACGETTIASKTTYNGDSSDGVLTTSHEGKESVTHVKAHRIGACP